MVYNLVCSSSFRNYKLGDFYSYDLLSYYDREGIRMYSILNFVFDIVGYLSIGQINNNFMLLGDWNSELKYVDNMFNFFMDHPSLSIFER